MKTILLSLAVLFCSLCSYASADVKETVTIEKYGKTFNLTAPDGFCFLSNNPLFEDILNIVSDQTNRLFDEETGSGLEHLEFAFLCEELNQMLDGLPTKDTLRIHFGMEGLQNFRAQIGSIKKLPSTEEFVSEMWQLFGDEAFHKLMAPYLEFIEEEHGMEVSPIQKIYKGKRCVYTLQGFKRSTLVGSAIAATCWINDRSVGTYLYKNYSFFESASEIQEALDILKRFNNSIN